MGTNRVCVRTTSSQCDETSWNEFSPLDDLTRDNPDENENGRMIVVCVDFPRHQPSGRAPRIASTDSAKDSLTMVHADDKFPVVPRMTPAQKVQIAFLMLRAWRSPPDSIERSQGWPKTLLLSCPLNRRRLHRDRQTNQEEECLLFPLILDTTGWKHTKKRRPWSIALWSDLLKSSSSSRKTEPIVTDRMTELDGTERERLPVGEETILLGQESDLSLPERTLKHPVIAKNLTKKYYHTTAILVIPYQVKYKIIIANCAKGQ